MKTSKAFFPKFKKIYLQILFVSFIMSTLNCLSQGAAINTSGALPDAAAVLDVSSNSQGILIPRLTTNERDNNIINPVNGLMIYNTDCNDFNYFNGSSWVSIISANSINSVALAATNITTTGFQANWAATPGASGYLLDVATDNGFSSFTINNLDVGNVNNYTVNSGLTCGATWYRIRAYNACGVVGNYSNIVSVNTPTTIQVSHTSGVNGAPVSKVVTYETVKTNITGSELCWITRNLGASQKATAATDNTEASAGWYYQFNRSQGFQYTTSLTPSSLWLTPINENSDWLTSNDPCYLNLGSGWRVPTASEWTNAINNGSWSNYNSTYNSAISLHAAGSLMHSSGTLSYRGSLGYYWSSTQSANDCGTGIFFSGSSAYMYSGFNYKSYGYTLRCVK